MPRVVFAHIDRRPSEQQTTLGERPFREDMRILATASEMELPRPDGTTWIAADLELDASGDFMTGVIGFVAEERLRDYAKDVRSWKKGPMRIEVGASRRTLVPFAIDIRDDQRWIAFAPAPRIREKGFVEGFRMLLEKAVTDLGLMPADWDVSLVVARSRLYEFLESNRDVREVRRTIKLPNPGIDLSSELERLRAMGGSKEYQRIVPRYSGNLDLLRDREVLDSLIEGLEQGDVELVIQTRNGASFRSQSEIEEATIDDWGEDWDRATDLVLDALHVFISGPTTQRRLDEEA